MKIHTITAQILCILLLTPTIAQDDVADNALITFRAFTDPISRKVLIHRETVPVKNLQEKELDAEIAIIPNVTLDESGNPSYSPADPASFDIKDIENLETDIMRYLKLIKYDILLNLKTSILVSAIDQSYLMYQNMAKIRDNYFINKPILRASITRIRNVTSFALMYAKEATKTQLKQLITAQDVELDEFNKKILIALLERLDIQAKKTWESTYIDLENLMQEIEKVYSDLQMTPANKLSRLIEFSMKLTNFEREVVDDGTNQMKGLIALIIDNPKYHHLTLGFTGALPVHEFSSILKTIFVTFWLILINY